MTKYLFIMKLLHFRLANREYKLSQDLYKNILCKNNIFLYMFRQKKLTKWIPLQKSRVETKECLITYAWMS